MRILKQWDQHFRLPHGSYYESHENLNSQHGQSWNSSIIVLFCVIPGALSPLIFGSHGTNP